MTTQEAGTKQALGSCSRDPIGYVESTCLYAYVQHSPANQLDPSGLQCYPRLLTKKDNFFFRKWHQVFGYWGDAARIISYDWGAGVTNDIYGNMIHIAADDTSIEIEASVSGHLKSPIATTYKKANADQQCTIHCVETNGRCIAYAECPINANSDQKRFAIRTGHIVYAAAVKLEATTTGTSEVVQVGWYGTTKVAYSSAQTFTLTAPPLFEWQIAADNAVEMGGLSKSSTSTWICECHSKNLRAIER